MLLSDRDLEQILSPVGRELLKQNLKCVALVWELGSGLNPEKPQGEHLQGHKDHPPPPPPPSISRS